MEGIEPFCKTMPAVAAVIGMMPSLSFPRLDAEVLKGATKVAICASASPVGLTNTVVCVWSLLVSSLDHQAPSS